MKNRLFLFCVMAVLAVSCVKEQQEIIQTITDDPVFHATIENADTRVFADDQLRVLWNADDRVSIFNKTTFNREYRFEGQDGDNSGTFDRVPSDKFVTSNPLDYVYSVYPYNENTSISNDGEITVYLPAEQTYRENSFGLGANTMIAITDDDELMFKNLCGYFAVKIYGDDVTVSSVSIKGNKDELLAGKAFVTASKDEIPTLQLDSAFALKELTLTFETPVILGSDTETATICWFVIPPTKFENGITLTVCDDKGGVFEQKASGFLEIKRNTLKSASALKIKPEKIQPNNVIYYTTIDAQPIMLSTAYWDVTVISNEYVDGLGIITFDRDVTSIGNRAFRFCRSLASISLPASVTSIESSAFQQCNSLASISIPEGVTSIGSYAFSGCSGLTHISIPDSVESIGSLAFSGCASLLSIQGKYATEDGLFLINESNCLIAAANGALGDTVFIPEGVTMIGGGVFGNCTKIITIILPNSVMLIDNSAFSGCSSLTNINIPDGVTSVGDMAFEGCCSLTSITIPDGVTRIGTSAFAHCSSLTSITIPDGVTRIGEGAFSGCTSLLSIRGKYATEDGLYLIDESNMLLAVALGAFSDTIPIPEGVTMIGSGTFADCTNLVSITIPEGVTNIGGSAFASCSNLTNINIPKSVTYIGGYTFNSCSSLTSITIPDGVTRIGASAFAYCSSLTSITIPPSTSFGTSLLSGCSSLTSVFVLSRSASRISDLFPAKTPPQDFFIYVPAENVSWCKSHVATGDYSSYADRILPLAPLPEAVDLGLTVKWASFNLGASTPEGYGNYYAWGEVMPKDEYSWATYKWCNGSETTMTNYNTNPSYGTVDDKTTLDPEDDAATVNLAGTWRMPTDAEWTELRTNCTWTWTTQNGVNGRLVTASNGNSIFLPAAGYRDDTSLSSVGSSGFYWSSSLNTDYPDLAWSVYFDSSDVGRDYYCRYGGHSVRPVCPKD